MFTLPIFVGLVEWNAFNLRNFTATKTN